MTCRSGLSIGHTSIEISHIQGSHPNQARSTRPLGQAPDDIWSIYASVSLQPKTSLSIIANVT